MSDDPKFPAPHRKPPADDSPLPAADTPPLDAPAEADALEEEQPAPEQESSAQAYETAESYEEETFHSAREENGQAPPLEGEEETYEMPAPEDAPQSAYEEPPVYEEPPAYEEPLAPEEAPLPHDAPTIAAGAKSIAPRHTARAAQMRSASSVEPKTPDKQILDLTYQLQELIAQKQSGPGGETEDHASISPIVAKSRRPSFKPLGPPAALRNPALQAASDQPQAQPFPPPAATKPPTGPPSPGMDWPMRVAVGLLGLCLLAGVFVAGRATSSIGGSSAGKIRREDAGPFLPASTAPWSESMLSHLDAALTADLAGEVEQAYRLATELRATSKLPIPGLDSYLANLEMRRGNFHEAEVLLSGAAEQGTLLNSDQFAYNFTRRRDFAQAAQWFSRAVTDNPFSAEGFYRLGETLRRQGNLQDAMKRLKAALVRLPAEPMYDTQREWIALKLRLAQIEAGQGADLQADLDAHLQGSPPSGYWTLTAAAVALQAGDQLAAAVALDKAKAALPPEQFKGLLSDYFFRAYVGVERMAPYFKEDPAAAKQKQNSRTTYFIDP